MEVMLGLSILCNVALALLVVLREKEHFEFEERQKVLNRCLKEELVDLIRRGRLL